MVDCGLRRFFKPHSENQEIFDRISTSDEAYIAESKGDSIQCVNWKTHGCTFFRIHKGSYRLIIKQVENQTLGASSMNDLACNSYVFSQRTLSPSHQI